MCCSPAWDTFLFLKLPVNSYSSFKTLLKGHLSCEIFSELQERIHYFLFYISSSLWTLPVLYYIVWICFHVFLSC